VLISPNIVLFTARHQLRPHRQPTADDSSSGQSLQENMFRQRYVPFKLAAMSLPDASCRPGRGRYFYYFLGAGLLAILAAFLLDQTVTGACFLTSRGTACQIARALSKYGDWPPILLAGLGTVAVLAIRRKFATGRLLLLVLVAGLLTGMATILIHTAVGRTRPSAPVPQGFYGLRYETQWTIGKYQFASFPSGHTAAWMGMAGVAWQRRRTWGLLLLVTGAAVGWSRMALGCHHLSDVTASLVWGMAVGPWMAAWLENVINRLWSKLGLPPG